MPLPMVVTAKSSMVDDEANNQMDRLQQFQFKGGVRDHEESSDSLEGRKYLAQILGCRYFTSESNKMTETELHEKLGLTRSRVRNFNISQISTNDG